MIPPLFAKTINAVPIQAVSASEWPNWSAERAQSLTLQAALADFRGQAGRVLLVTGSDGALERVLLGLGDIPNAMSFGALGKDLPAGDYVLDGLPKAISLTQAAIAFALGAYAFDTYKPRKRPPPRLTGLASAFGEADRVARAVYWARDLVNLPANAVGPARLQAEAEGLAARIGGVCNTLVGEELLQQSYPMIHAVGRAAAESPRLIHVRWGDEAAPRIALVGKGVCFDSGGLDIKADSAMRLMKKDMGGAAVVLGLTQAIAESNLPVRLDVWIPAVENAIGAGAFRPGDVLASRKGPSVEVDNTDAEGRLILGDALARAAEENPELTLDFATLTGAARVALGQDLTPLFTDDDSLAADFADAGRTTHDMTWRLPLWSPYETEMDCQAADMKNAGDTGQAGAILGGLFLKRFAPKGAWAHLDTYCWTLRERPGRPTGADAQGLRAALAVLAKRYPPAAPA